MANKNTKGLAKYVLPTANTELLSFVKSNKVPMMEHTINSIQFAIENNLPIVEVFQFKDSKFVITLSTKDYLSNLNNIYKFYMDKELYELCKRVVTLQNILKETSNHNEKEQKEQRSSGQQSCNPTEE